MTREEAAKLKKMLTQLGFEVPKEVTAKLAEEEEEEELLCENCGCPAHPCLPCEEALLLNGNHTDEEYFDLLRLILHDGRRKKNRTGVDTIGVFGAQAKFDVDLDAFPILTTKKVWFKGIVHELLWFIRGDTNIKYLVDNDVHIWDEWAYARYKKGLAPYEYDQHGHMVPTEPGLTQDQFIQLIKEDAHFAKHHGELGEGTYGGMWRRFPVTHYYDQEQVRKHSKVGDTVHSPDGERYELFVDQLQKVMDKLKKNPDDRRIIVSAWHPYWVDHCALPPCHCLFHFNTEELTIEERHRIYSNHERGTTDAEVHKAYDDSGVPRRRLNCLLYQRSCDTFLGVPFNITSYCLLTALIAHCSNMVPGVFTHTYGDLHIYENHLEQVKEQMSRTPKVLPKLWLNPKVRNLSDFKFEDIKLEGYNSHPAIKAPIAV